MKTIDKFRNELEKATKGHPREHIENITALKENYPHNIVCLNNQESDDKLIPRIYDSTEDCFVYVFKKFISEQMLISFIEASKRNQTSNIPLECLLISKGFIDLHRNQTQFDKIIVYFNDKIAKHFAFIENNLIISKWGKGNVWQHELWEVPLSYGNEVMYSNGEIDKIIFNGVVSQFTNNIKNIEI